ncbi:methyltransferase domain-containing protein [Actinomyces sp. ZJ308]|uniref:methyltransferase domain-containing protein n=1 Tax=Actinomyces sp. ZJ308 TaxID=2708342 RepID=UPI00141F3380|nr:methyltransferase domain-containing protein [Actinomyces sp. ZJ308]
MSVTAPRAPSCLLHDAGTCRSCPHLSLPLPDQLAVKQSHVTSLLAERIPAGLWEEPAASAPERFRNKAKMAVAGTTARPTLGILDGAGHGVDLPTCPLHVPAIEAALPVLADLVTDLGLLPYDVPGRRGELKHVLVTASPDDDLMVRFVLRSRRHLGRLRAALPDLQRSLPQLAVAGVNIQGVHQAVIEGPEEIVLTEEDRLLMRLSLPSPGTGPSAGRRADDVELPLYLPTRSFFQTNTAVAEALYATARAWGEESDPALVWDLFCGVGGFALALAAPGRRVLGVEVSAPAIDGARDAAALMGLEPALVRFEAGDARLLDPAAPADGATGAIGATGAVGAEAPDLLVVNPPRRGIGERLATRIEASGVERVLYSSCNPRTLAADLTHLSSMRVVRARLFDMFPHTDHAEVLVELVRA